MTNLLAIRTAIAIGLLFPNLQKAQTSNPPPSTLTAIGEAKVSARPDRAEVVVGVTSTAKTAKDAAAQNAMRSEAMIGKLRSAMGKQIEIETVSYNLNPDYRPPRPGDQEKGPEINGYTATNLLRVTVLPLADAGKVIDLATEAGANRIHSLEFSLKDRRAVESQALGNAAREARSKAEALAASLGLRILRVLSVTESGGVHAPPRPMMAAAMERASYAPPVEPGAVEVSAMVTLTVEVGGGK
jgi:uncharacterized protein YggE